MATVTAPRKTPRAAAIVPGAGQSVLLSTIGWDQYVQLDELLAEQRVRTTYDHGDLEIMVLSSEHERFKHLLSRLVEVLADELDRDIAGYGSMTCRKEKLQRGLEPDECYWIANEPKVRGQLAVDLQRDPPPDLALEIDISHSSLDRMAVYAALQVAEVWRFDGATLTFHQLAKGKKKYANPGRAGRFLG